MHLFLSPLFARIHLKFRIFFASLIFVLAGKFQVLAADAPLCTKGVADLRSLDFSKGGYKLDGAWEFYWKQFIPSHPSSSAQNYFQVPAMWLAEGKPGQGYASYRLQVLLPKTKHDIGLKIPEFSTAYELHVNGVVCAKNGKISQDAEAGQAAYQPLLIRLPKDADTLELIFHVSNYHYYTGGIPQSIAIGNYDELINLRESQIIYGSMLFGILIIIGMFHISIYFFRPKEKYNLYYSLYCLLLALNTLFVTERWLFGISEPGMWPFLYKVFLSTIYLVLLTLILFYSSFFENVIRPWVRRSLVIIFGLQSALVLILPSDIGSWLEPVAGINLLAAGIIAIFIFAKAIWLRKEGAILIAICNFAFLASFILDGFLTTNQISGIHLSHYVTVLYVVVLSLILSRRIANAFNNVEALSVGLQTANSELSHLNKHLEQEVKDRTRQVLQQEKMAALGQLTANIAHEVNTPMGAIKASIETIAVAYERSLNLFPKVIEELNPTELGLFVDLLNRAWNQQSILSSKEEREKRKTLRQALEDVGVEDANTLSGKFSHAGIYELNHEQLELLRKPGIDQALAFLFEHFEQITSTRNIQTALERVNKIMFAIKLYSRGGSSNEKTQVNVEQEILATTALYSNWFKKGIELKTDFAPLPPLLCYADELLQVWTNLILNAVQSMGNTGILEIKTFQEANDLVVTITDNGPGIPEDIIDKIFEPFFTTKISGEGSGLGLDIVRTIITRQGGQIAVKSQPGQTCFTVRLPYPNS